MLDQVQCAIDCTHDSCKIVLVGACHPRAGLAVAYVKLDGTMDIVCKECGKPVVTILVAKDADAQN